MTRKLAAIVAMATALAGCASSYTLEGQKYASKEELHRASEGLVVSALNTISPLPSPLTQKKLVFAIPSEPTIRQENVSRVTQRNGSAPNAMLSEQIENITKANYRSLRVFYDAVQKRGIYASTQLREMPSMAVSLEPSSDTDVIYLTEPAPGTGQWFYASQKHGRQLFAYDRSGVGTTSKVQAFMEAVQAQAIRD